MYAGYLEEGDKCPECGGVLKFGTVEGCSCHINPPCSACVNNPLTCEDCGWKDDSPAFRDIPVVLGSPGISQREYKPRKLDNTKIDYVIKMHTHFTQICEGVYPDWASIEDVRKKVNGTFGGRFEQFGDGKFKFIAYTD